MTREWTLALVSFFLILFSACPVSSLQRDYVSYYSGTSTVLEGMVEEELGGLTLPLSLEVHSVPRFYSTSSGPGGEFSFGLGGLEPGTHEFWLRIPAPGYEPSSSLLQRLSRENLEILREGGELVIHGSLQTGRVRNLGVLELLFRPFSLSLLENSALSFPVSFQLVAVPHLVDRQVVTGYREENTASGWRWKEWAQTGARTENRSLGPEAGSWVPTGRTYTIYGVGPLHTGLPSLPSGYRWTKVSGDWNSATYREEVNRVEVLRGQGWTVTPQYRTVTEYQADVYHWEKVGSHKEYGPWTKSGTTTLATGLTGPPSGVTNGREEMVSETEKRAWWVTSYTTQVPSGYVYNYALYKRSWRWLPPGWGSWKYQGSGTETFASYRGLSFTTGGGFTDDWKKEYTYSHTVYTTGTRYSYGYDTYTRTVRVVDDYGWVFRGRQTFSSPPVSGSGWDYRNVTSSTRQELTGYLATRAEPVYGWAERSGERPPADGTVYWENGKLGEVVVLGIMGRPLEVKVEYPLTPQTGSPQPGYVTELQRTYTVVRTPIVEVENYTAYRVYEVPTSWSPVSATVALAPKNGYAGPVYLEASGGSLGASELRFSSPASTTLTVSPNSPGTCTATVRAYAVDLSGRRREVASGSLRVAAEGSARLVGVEGVLPSDNYEVTMQVTGQSVGGVVIPPNVAFGPIYDGGSLGSPITQSYTVNIDYPWVLEDLRTGKVEYLRAGDPRILNPPEGTIVYQNYLDPVMRERARKEARGVPIDFDY